MTATSVVLAGVAGQPVMDAARLLAEAALAAGLDATLVERTSPLACAGPVSAHVRFGEEVRSPVVRDGGADFLAALEPIEALRAMHLLSRSGLAAVADRLLPTWRMRAGLEPAPDVLARLRAVTPRVAAVPIESLVQPPGGRAYAGLALLGFLSPALPLPAEAFRAALARRGGADLDARRDVFERARDLFAILPDDVAGAALDIARARR